jgi:hypothetical protein
MEKESDKFKSGLDTVKSAKRTSSSEIESMKTQNFRVTDALPLKLDMITVSVAGS